MIEGYFGNEDELFFEIELISTDGLELPVDALLDTGFSGWLALDEQDLEELNWTYVGKQTMRMAKGESTFDIYLGKVRIDGQEFDIPAYAGEGVTEFLIGRQWLKTKQLVVDFPSGILTLEAS